MGKRRLGRRWQPGRRLGLILLFAGALAGCATPGPGAATLTPEERLELESRSLDLLLRAATTEIDVVACNAIEALVQVAPHDGRSAFRQALGASSPLARYAGYVALGELRDCTWPADFVRGTQDPAPRVRLAAAFAAYRCGQHGYGRMLLRALTDNPDENLRADAAYLIGRLGDPDARPALRAALSYPANRDSNRVLLHLQWALAMLGDEAAAEYLIGSTLRDVASADALLIVADLGHPEAEDALRFRMRASSAPHVEPRLVAARGLGKLGNRDGFDLAAEMIRYVDTRPHPEDPDRQMRIRSLAAHALGEIGDPRALPLLRQLAAQSTDERLQVAACYAICKILAPE